MLPIKNISITKAAETVLRQQLARTRLGSGDVFGLVYIEFFKEPDGSTVKGFVPAYRASAWKSWYITSDWLRVQASGGLDFYFLPKFTWSSRAHYLVDNAPGDYALFSIKPT